MIYLGKDDLKELLNMREAIELVEKGFLQLHQHYLLTDNFQFHLL